MKIPRIVNAVGSMEDDLICDAVESKKPQKKLWMKWGSLAACFLILIAAGSVVLPSLWSNRSIPEPERIDRPYKDITINGVENGILWPWEDRTVYEKYREITVNGDNYNSRGREIGAALVGEKMGTYEATGYDDLSEGIYREVFEVYQISGISSDELVAVKMDGSYYVFMSDEWNPPATWGEVIERYDLTNVLEFHRFTVKERGEEDQYFTLNGDQYIWDVLSACQNAEFVDPLGWMANERDYLSFTVTSEALGVYKHALYVTADGYLWTNAFDGEFLYFIGENTAGKILDYAKSHSSEAEYEPYSNSIVGKVTDITDDYIFVDDSILCVDPSDGMVFKIPTEDMRIRRYIEHGIIGVGNTVVVSYEGEIDTKAGNLIHGVYSMSEAIISDGNVWIEE